MNLKSAIICCLILIALLFVPTGVNSYKILGISFSSIKSHFIFFNSLMRGLAEDGNNVTFITPFQPYNPHKSLRHIRFEFPIDIQNANDRPVHSTLDVNGLNCFAFTNIAYKLSNAYVSWTINSKQFQEFLKQNENFDVVLVQTFVGEAILSLGHYFNAPVIAVFPSTASKWTRDMVGAPNLASFIPHTLTGYSDKMDFWQRQYNALCYLYDDVANPLIYAPVQQKLLDSMYSNGKKMPPLDVIKRNISLVLYNSHPLLETPAPIQPNMIPVAGLSIKNGKPDPLSNEINTFLNESKGVIYVSFGSHLDFSEFDQSKKDAVINAFNEFQEFRIIFKSKEKIIIPSHNASDVMIRSWMPQQAILAHKNVKVFITQGGTLSITEAIHFAKPIICIATYFDQNFNMNMAEQRGYGVGVPYEELTTGKLQQAIRKVLTDPSYTEKVQLISKYFRNQIKPPLDTAIYWVKYVAKHRGAPHLRSIAIDMPFYVYYNLDCWAFLILSCIFTIFVITITCQALFSRFFKRRSTNKYKIP